MGDGIQVNPNTRVSGFLDMEPRRDPTNLVKSDIKDVATMFYDGGSIELIAEAFDVNEIAIRHVITGENFSRQWEEAVIDLIVSGVDCSRPTKRTEFTKPRPRLLDEEARLIRQMHIDGDTAVNISDNTSTNIYTVKNIIRDRIYDRPECRPDGWDDR